jgi:competence protein ComEA
LSDEQHISVPRLGEVVQELVVTPSGVAEADGSSASATPQRTPSGKTNINTATAKELEQLPGIGEVLANRIVTNREANGPFKTVDDLMRVPGIKEGLMSKLRDLVMVGP